MNVDLHVHSNMSDGTLPPSALIDLAKKNDVSVIALTDHDTTIGIKEAENAAAKAREDGYPITLVPGVEISVYYKNIDIHVLGLLIDETDEILNQALTGANQKRSSRNEEMASRFRKNGIPITLDKLYEQAKGKTKDAVITRAHFASYLISNGIAKNTQDAFDRFLGDDGPYYIPREYLEPQKGIELIHGAGGLSFIAHPFLYGFSQNDIEQMIIDFKKLGIDGIEALHSTHTIEQEETLVGLAKKHNLLITGGSDFHGDNKPNIDLGFIRENTKIPYSIYENILNEKI